MAKKKKRGARAEAKRDAVEAEAQQSAGAEPRESQPQPVTESAPVSAVATSAPAAAPDTTSRSRALANAYIACFLLFMLAMPLRYYLGGRGFDERFAWRMFSTIRMLDCKAMVDDVRIDSEGLERAKPVKLTQEVQVAWIGMLERARGLVVKNMLGRRCDEPGVDQARFLLQCKSPDGTTLPDVAQHMECKTRELITDKGAP